MPKKNVAIVFGVTADYVSQLANVLIGIQKYSPKLADNIIIYHDGISEEKQQQLHLIGQSLIFIHYNYNNSKYLQKETLKSYSIVVFSHYECFELLNDYTKVLWFDVDILIQKDISGLLQYGDKTGFSCTVNAHGMPNLCNFFEPIPSYSMYTALYNVGLLILKDTLKDYIYLKDWCYKKTHEIAPLLRWPEQGIINLLIQEFSINIELIDILRYVCHQTMPSVSSADIVHTYGSDKFWNSMELDMAFPQWSENNKQWQHIVATETHSKIPKVTVLMTVYRRSLYLKEAVCSILNQTLSELELLVVIEKSPEQDNIERLLRDLHDTRIIIVKNIEKLGFAASLNVGLDLSQGEYIARMDDDDYSVPERLQVQVDFMDANPEVGIVGSYIKCFGSNVDVWDKISLDHVTIKARLLTETQLYHPTVMMRKSMLEEHNLRYDPTVFTEDYDLWARAVAVTKLANIPKILVRYRASNSNATLLFSHHVQASHLSVMRKQIETHLGITPTSDELILLSRRVDILSKLPDRTVGKKQKRIFTRKLCTANKISKYYDQYVLEKIYLGEGISIPGYSALDQPKKNASRVIIGFIKRVIIYSVTSIVKIFLRNIQSTGYLQIIKDKLFNQREYILHQIKNMNNEIYLNTMKMCKETNENVLDLHEHIDWVQRDILIALKERIDFNASQRFICLTEYPVAYDSPDHIHLVGTVADHTRHPRFIRACEDFFPNKKHLSFLNLGCSAGGIVLDAVLRGHIGVGLEGRDISHLQQRAEWRLLREHLFTCDISKPFTLTQDESAPFMFDVVSAWEVLEHLTKEGMDGLFCNLNRHMHAGSILVCSISQVEGGFTDSSIPLHQTLEPLAWWEEIGGRHGFELMKNPPFARFDYARGNGNPSIYYKPLHSYKEQPDDCELAIFRKIAQ